MTVVGQPRPALSRPAVLRLVAAFLGLAAIHLALAFNQLITANALILTGFVVALAVSVMRRRPAVVVAALAALVVVFATTAVLLIEGYASAASLLSAPSFLGFACFTLIFGRSLLPNHEPLINRFIRQDLVAPPPEALAWGRRLTVIWTALLGFMAIESVVVVLLVDVQTWSWLINIANPIILVSFFLGQHVHAMTYRPDGRPASPAASLRAMFKPTFWAG